MRCQPGDLAIIIRDAGGAGNEGREVDVIRWVEPGAAVPESSPTAAAMRAGWVVRGRYALRGMCVVDGDPTIAVWPDVWLLPLRPPAKPRAEVERVSDIDYAWG